MEPLTIAIIAGVLMALLGYALTGKVGAALIFGILGGLGAYALAGGFAASAAVGESVVAGASGSGAAAAGGTLTSGELAAGTLGLTAVAGAAKPNPVRDLLIDGARGLGDMVSKVVDKTTDTAQKVVESDKFQWAMILKYLGLDELPKEVLLLIGLFILYKVLD